MAAQTLGEVVRSLAPDGAVFDQPLWPPDVFALTSRLLWETDAYVNCVSPPPKRKWPPAVGWGKDVYGQAREWVKALNRPGYRKIQSSGATWLLEIPGVKLPAPLQRRWSSAISARSNAPLIKLRKQWSWIESLLWIHAVADEAGRDLGRGVSSDSFGFLAYERLRQHHTLALIDPERGRVLPKFHTPQSGIALRSLSRNLAFDRSPTEVVWNHSSESVLQDPQTVRCLVLPWPLAIPTRDFREWRTDQVALDCETFGFFDFAPGAHAGARAFGAYLRRALDLAVEEMGVIDMVVLPELALTDAQVQTLGRECAKRGIGMYVCGVRRPPSTTSLGENLALTAWRAADRSEAKFDSTEQHKHHRWCLDSSQVAQYQLGGVLHARRSWWEAIQVPQRRLAVTKLGREMSLCTLVCEDLARQDPMASLLRSIGPSLVIALLMDGPQLLSRWPARYAAVLADDPGSSVLTVTSLGMAARSLGPDGKASRVIALWKDPTTGPREVALDPGSIGVVLSLCAKPRNERTADNRGPELGDGSRRYALVLSGVVQLPEEPDA